MYIPGVLLGVSRLQVGEAAKSLACDARLLEAGPVKPSSGVTLGFRV